jgi:putative ATP-dependent endonuclease of OLD family
VNLDFSTPDRKQMLIKKEMAEMFFADLVILTEDCKHFIEEVSKIV